MEGVVTTVEQGQGITITQAVTLRNVQGAEGN